MHQYMVISYNGHDYIIYIVHVMILYSAYSAAGEVHDLRLNKDLIILPFTAFQAP